MNKFQLIGEIRAAMADPARIGDIPALKSELTGARARPEIEAQLAEVRGYAPTIDLDELAKQGANTFGYAYARFMRENKLHAIAMTGKLDPALVERNAFVVRYGIIHDMIHVLTGFDTSWPGEVGVWAFVGAQNYSRGFRVTAWVALFAALFRCPLQLGRAWRCFRRGRKLGASSSLLLTMKLEQALPRELTVVRGELGLPASPAAI